MHFFNFLGKPVNWNELEENLKKLQIKTINYTERKSNNYMIRNIPKTDDHFKYEVIRHNNESYLSPVLIAKLLAIVDINGNIVAEPDIKQQGDMVSLVLDKTSFYCKAGGQQNDIGIVKTNNGIVFDVIDVDKIEENGVVLHHIKSRDWPILFRYFSFLHGSFKNNIIFVNTFSAKRNYMFKLIQTIDLV